MTAPAPAPSPRTQRLAVITPLANERDTIDEFVRRVVAQLLPQDRLITVFDNVTNDGSLNMAREIAQSEPRLHVVFAPENRCVVDAYFRGYREALATDADWILEMDGGLSHLPEEIPPFLDAMARGHDYAGGSRFMAGGGFDGPWSRYLISRGGTLLTNLLVGTRMRDMTSGFECFTRQTLQLVVDEGVQSRAHFFQTEIRTRMHDLKWVELPIHYNSPSSSVGKASLSEAFRILFQLRQRRRHELAARREKRS
jgi:dolichol-phosphate mannosyltransferase